MPLQLHTLLLKTVNHCNLACDYCYARRFHEGQAAGVISDEIVKRAISDYVDLADNNRGTGPEGHWMVFLWHGGEPTLAGIDFYDRVVQAQMSTGRADTMINSITSNGTLIDQAWLDLLKEYQFRLSISIDGPQPVHDMHRFTRDGKSSFARVVNSIDLLQKNHHPFGVMCVITEESASQADEVFHFLVEQGVKRLAFLPRIAPDAWLQASEYARFMTRVFDLWLARDDPNIYIREFENIIHELLGGQAELCEFNGCCGSYLAIDFNGDVYLCDLFIGDESMRVGNILDGSLGDILDSSETRQKIDRKTAIHSECLDCVYLPICKGGCLYRRCLPRGKPSDKDLYCLFRQELFQHVAMRLSGVFSRLSQSFRRPPVSDLGATIAWEASVAAGKGKARR